VNIVGVGNTLMGDDGVGPALVQHLAARGVPDGVVLHDAGLAAGDVLGRLDPTDPLVVVDAVRAGGEPGGIVRLRLEARDLFDASGPAEGDKPPMLSLHEVSVVPALRLEALAGRVFRDVTAFGVEPGGVDWGEGLSPAVGAALDRLADAVLRYVVNEPAAAAAGDSSRCRVCGAASQDRVVP
jgi:hydrogenase maturation protease